MRKTVLPLVVLVLVAATLTSATARSAEAATHEGGGAPDTDRWIIRSEGNHTRPTQLDISLGLWYRGAGAGIWYAIPIVPNGFIPRVNDSFDIEFGVALDLDFWGYDPYVVVPGLGLDVTPLAGVRWNFFLTTAWSVFAAIKLGWTIAFNGWSSGFAGSGSVGAMYQLDKGINLRLEAGYPMPISVGLSFDI